MAATAKDAVLALQLTCRGDAARESTLRDWVKFLEGRSEASLLQNLPKTPAGAAIDWLKLYEEVVARGGFSIVSQRQQWAELQGANGLNIKGLMPYQLAAHYDKHLRAFEEKQLFGRDLPPSQATMSVLPSKRRAQPSDMTDDEAPVATMQDLHDAQGGMGGTPLPRANKRFKAQRELQTHLGSLHSIVLALDSDIPEQVMQALNLLTVLSYGDGSGDAGASQQQMQHHHHTAAGSTSATANANATANENELLVDNVPGLLDALYRQLVACKVLPGEKEVEQQQARRRLLNLTVEDGERELLDSRALVVLNIIRNLAIIGANEKPIAAHDELCVFFIMALRYVNSSDARNCRGGRSRAAVDIGDHVLDTLCAISKRIDFLALHPPAALEVWHPQYQLSAQLWKKERVLPLECLLRELRRILVDRELKQQRRSVVLRACELLTNVCRDVGIKKYLSSSEALQDPALLDRVVGLMGCSRQEFLPRGSKHKRQQQAHGFPAEADYDMDAEDSDDSEDDETDGDDNSRWPAPWENDGLPSGIGMGVVYVSPEGVRHTTSSPHVGGAHAAHSVQFDDEANQLDHEMRDAALEVLFRLSDYDDATKLRMAQHPTCMRRLAGSLLSCVGRPEAARITVATLCNISMNRATFPYFLAIEKDLILVACSDVSVSDILNNVVADVYGMHSL
ncbi:NEDD4 E3 ubiquitin-protein ligase WWP2 [Phytophthora cinnamomi]|uniref:NEDD4 E3 ubiquitin-protein ligase WWP2 n=1 Tax=Phytophthora cinnamomi TaxID=4785 RepID=UPI00355A805A|nr:NEDD4 E3 ubiquitin-protein ligase WWP2 [Phytophthora cinnamomi]